jgi:hypothetical protein
MSSAELETVTSSGGRSKLSATISQTRRLTSDGDIR